MELIRFTATCGHETVSRIDQPTSHKRAVRRLYWRSNPCTNCRHIATSPMVQYYVTARCGHAVTIRARERTILGLRYRQHSRRYYWRERDCSTCRAGN